MTSTWREVPRGERNSSCDVALINCTSSWAEMELVVFTLASTSPEPEPEAEEYFFLRALNRPRLMQRSRPK